jgi:hypothetical protein
MGTISIFIPSLPFLVLEHYPFYCLFLMELGPFTPTVRFGFVGVDTVEAINQLNKIAPFVTF